MMAFIFSVRRKISTEESILEAIEGLRGAFRLHKSISDMMYSQIAVLESRIVKLEANEVTDLKTIILDDIEYWLLQKSITTPILITRLTACYTHLNRKPKGYSTQSKN